MPIEFDVRYFLEHKAMPRALYATGAQLMASLMQSKGAAVRGFYRKAERANPSYQCPYSDKDFSDKDPRLQHPYSSFPFDTADLDSPSNGHLI